MPEICCKGQRAEVLSYRRDPETSDQRLERIAQEHARIRADLERMGESLSVCPACHLEWFANADNRSCPSCKKKAGVHVLKTCALKSCGAAFRTPRSDPRIYHSRDCYLAACQELVTVACVVCGELVQRQAFKLQQYKAFYCNDQCKRKAYLDRKAQQQGGAA